MELKDRRARGFNRMVRGKIAANVFIVSLLAVILMVFVNVGVNEYAADHEARFDLSDHRIASLEEATKQLLRNLDGPIQVYLVSGYDEKMREAAKPYVGARLPDQGILRDVYGRVLQDMVGPIKRRLDEASRYSPYLRVYEADVRSEVDRPRQWARDLGIEGTQLVNHLIFRNPRTGARKAFSFYKLHQVDLGGPDPTRGRVKPHLGGEFIEQHLMFGIKTVLDRESPVVYVTAGHEEVEIPTALQLLQGDNFDVRAINLGVEASIPADADVVVVPSPRRPMRPEALDALEAYADRGGRMMLLTGRDSREPFARLLETFGVEAVNAQIGHPTAHNRAEGKYSLFGVSLIRPDKGAAPHRITSPAVRDALPIYLGYSRSLRLIEDYDRKLVSRSVLAHGGPDALVMPLAFTGDAWRQAPERPRPDVGDAPLMIACERRLVDDEASLRSRLLIAGSHDWLGDRPITSGFNLCNGDVLQNSFYWLTDEETLITGTPRSFRGRFAALDEDSHGTFRAIIVVLLPVLLLLAGALIHVIRRR